MRCTFGYVKMLFSRIQNVVMLFDRDLIPSGESSFIINVFDSGTTEKRTVSDPRNTGGDIYACKLRTIAERIISDARNTAVLRDNACFTARDQFLCAGLDYTVITAVIN